MKSTIIEAAESLTQEGRVAKALGALGMAAVIATGSPIGSPATSKAPSNNTSSVESPASSQSTSKDTPSIASHAAKNSRLSYSTSYLNFIKMAENSIRDGWNEKEQKWYPHGSPEGGNQTIAYGHKIKNDAEQKRFDRGITEQEALDLLEDDLDDAWNKAAKYVKDKHGVNLSDLNTKQQEMLTDYAFNLGSLNGFPKFTKAVVERDLEGARNEYRRTFKDENGKRHGLARNKVFYDRYLKSAF